MKTNHKLLLLLFFLAVLLPAAGLPARGQAVLPRWEKEPSAEQIIRHEGFTVSYNNKDACPNWVAWELTPEEASANVTGRTDFFTEDPLAEGKQASYKDFKRTPEGYERGHMAPSADFKWSKTANEQTFYFTNICAQNHVLNEGMWLELEQRCRTYAKMYRNPVQIVCGPVFKENEHTYFSQKNIRIPHSFFKAILVKAKGRTYGIAFIMHNQPISAMDDIFRYEVSFDYLREITGLDPFPGMEYTEPGKKFPFNISWKKPQK